jgi:hypothetical protein
MKAQTAGADLANWSAGDGAPKGRSPIKMKAQTAGADLANWSTGDGAPKVGAPST